MIILRNALHVGACANYSVILMFPMFTQTTIAAASDSVCIEPSFLVFNLTLNGMRFTEKGKKTLSHHEVA